ncbi:MAG: DUF255 domain-containing protein [Anaerolineae bacterium]|nr:DUF255 domain-containing protein [Anaerolineae bacterium]
MADVQPREVAVSIPWRQWTPEAFREARDRDVPILLSISAVWCHWCHVMDESTYREGEVVRRVTGEVVPILVDADRRPDVNNRYNLGGWPTTAFLIPEGDLLTGGTFMPAEELLTTLDEVTGYYRNQRADLEQRLDRRRQRRARMQEIRHRLRGSVTPEIVDNVVEATRKSFDPEHGGFGEAPKFPLPDTIEPALALGHAGRDPALLDIAGATLAAMAEGGVYDRVGGGFFRYSTTADWSRPHYEKMLDGNARLLSTYLHAAQVLDQPLFWRTARDILAFAETTLHDVQTGGFAGSVEAEEEYYRLGAEERAWRTPPAMDPTLFTSWNAMMILAYLEAATVLDEPYLGDHALDALEAIWRLSYAPGSGMAHYYDGTPRVPGLLADQAWMGQALLKAHAYVGHGDYLQRAEALMDVMRSRLMDPDVGGFYDVPHDPAALGRLRERLKLLDENAVAADVALQLHRLTGKDDYYDAAAGTLEAIAPIYRPYRHHAAPYALAVYRFVYPPLHLMVVGEPRAELTRKLRQTALSIYDPNRLVETVDPQAGAERLQRLGLQADPSPALYVRRGRQTSGPIQDPNEVRTAVEAVPA